MDKTLFIKNSENDIILVQVYVDNIIFGSTNELLCQEFVLDMQGEFEMSMMGELNYFLGLQIKQLQNGTNVGLWYLNEVTLNLKGYSYSDFVGCKLDRKSTSGTCHLLGASLISWNSKKQACVALSTTEAKYIAIGSCCAQICWLKQQLSNFGLKVTEVPLFCDNTSAINLTKHPVHHSRTKHIEIRHHFIREQVSNGICEIKFIESEKQLTDFLTKPLAKDKFNYLRTELGILDYSNIA